MKQIVEIDSSGLHKLAGSEVQEVSDSTIQQFADGQSLVDWTKAHTTQSELSGQSFTYLKHIPENHSGNLIIVGGEYANDLHVGVALRAQVIRNIVDPNAALLIQPNSSIRQNNLNFSAAERVSLSDGNLSPLTDRIRVAVDSIPTDGFTAMYAPSQAAFVLGAYAAHPDTDKSAIALIEAPNTHNRSLAALAIEYALSGRNLESNLETNFASGLTETPLQQLIYETISTRGLLEYAAGAVRADNRALLTAMRTESLSADISKILLKGGSVVQAWGTQASVSGDVQNSAIANNFLQSERYEAMRLVDSADDHSLTNRYDLNGALTKLAVDQL